MDQHSGTLISKYKKKKLNLASNSDSLLLLIDQSNQIIFS